VINKELTNEEKTVDRSLSLYLLALISLTYLAFSSSKSRAHRNKTIKREQRHRCFDCGTKCTLEIHHITPLSKGGTNKRSNLVALGASTNEGGCGCHDIWDDFALSNS
jgi:hypothetical protein